MKVSHFPAAPDGVLVAYSGGKDSLVVLDLCIEHYGADKVQAFFMYFLPGLDYSRAVCAYAEDRWGIPVLQVQHWVTSEFLHDGYFCTEQPTCPVLTEGQVEDALRKRTGKRWLGWGYRKADSLNRRRMLTMHWPNGINTKKSRFSPIVDWTDGEVHAYLKQRRIPILGGEFSARRGQNGIDTDPPTMHFLRTSFPNDYKKVLEVFPYAAAQADRWLVIKADRDRKRRPARADEAPDV